MIVVVKCLTILADDRQERNSGSILTGNTIDCTGNLLFNHTWTTHLHHLQVHFGTNRTSPFDLVDLILLFDFAQRHYSFGQFNRNLLFEGSRLQAEQFTQHQGHLTPIRRQIVNLPALGNCLLYRFGQLSQSGRPGYPHLLGLLSQRWLRTHPDNIIDRVILSEQHILS